MMSDADIWVAMQTGDIEWREPLPPEQIGPASVDLTLNEFYYRPPLGSTIDTAQVDEYYAGHLHHFTSDLTVYPNTFYIMSTYEHLTLSDKTAARVEGRSSLGRLGLCVHVTAGFIDPGFSGTITLEVVNLGPRPIKLYAGMRICQVAFFGFERKVVNSYKKVGHYGGQDGPTPARAGDIR